MNIFGNELGSVVGAAAERLKIELAGNTDAWREYAAERMLHLSNILGEPGYQEALAAETVNVALRAAGDAVDSADAIDRELFGIIAGGLAVGARALAGGAV